MQNVPAADAASHRVPAEVGLATRIVRAVGWTLIWLGLLTLGFVAHQLWVTSWLSERNQSQLASERVAYYDSAEITVVDYTPTVVDPDSGEIVPGAGSGDPASLLSEAAPPLGQPFALIRIPKIERLQEGWTVVEGVRLADLRTGAGHMPNTPLPGQPGNAVISGHRTTYGAPFHELDLLAPGDTIEVETALGTHVYAVRESFIVRPTEIWVTNPKPGAWLTLTTCNPKFSARERLIVTAELVEGPNAPAILGLR
jgi:sortase A